jgi:hypothetical protein
MKNTPIQLPADAPTEALHYIDTGFWHISSKTASKLAKASKHGTLPRHGYEIDVTLSNGKTATLSRTFVSCFTWQSERAQVWAIHNIRQSK